MIVIAIIAILATILIVQWIGAREAAYRSEALTVARNCVLAAQVYYAAEGNFSYAELATSHLFDIESSIEEFHNTAGNWVEVDDSGDDYFIIIVRSDRGNVTFTARETGVDDGVTGTPTPDPN